MAHMSAHHADLADRIALNRRLASEANEVLVNRATRRSERRAIKKALEEQSYLIRRSEILEAKIARGPSERSGRWHERIAVARRILEAKEEKSATRDRVRTLARSTRRRSK